MKKRTKLTFVVSFCLILALFASLLMPGMNALAARQTQTISDSFDGLEFKDAFDTRIWTDYMADSSIKIKELSKPEKVMGFEGSKGNGEIAVLMSTDWYWEIHSFSFDFKIPAGVSSADGSWAAIDFVDIDEPQDYVGDYGEENGKPMCYGSMRVCSDLVFGIPNMDWTDWGFSDKKISDTWVSVKIVSDEADTGKLYIAPKGKKFDETKGYDIYLGEGRSFHNANIVFLDYKFSGYQLDNIVIETDKGVFKENFENGESKLFTPVTCYTSMTDYSIGVMENNINRKLTIENAMSGDILIANSALKQEDEHLGASEEVMNTSFSVKFNGNDVGEEIAYVFGLHKNDSNPFSETWAYIMNRKGGRLVRYGVDGSQEVLGKNNFSSAGTGSALTLSLTKGGTFKVSENGSQVLKCKGVTEYKGYAGFVAVTETKKPIYIDDLVISNTIYNVVTTKTVSHDFEIDNLGTPSGADFGHDITGGVISISNGELLYEGCYDGTWFGPAYPYETYEMTFKLTSILGTEDKEAMEATGPDRWIGIDVGKKDSTQRAYGTYGMIYIRITPPSDGTDWKEAAATLYKADNSDMEGEDFKVVTPIPASLFKDITYDGTTKSRADISADAAVCFKVVATENRVDLYMKRVDQEKYTLYVTLDNVKPEGYVNIACTAYTFWTLDDFEVKNTASIYNEPVVKEETEFVPVSLEERGIDVEDRWWSYEQTLNANTGYSIPVVICIVTGVLLVGVGISLGCLSWRKKKRSAEKDTQNKEDVSI